MERKKILIIHRDNESRREIHNILSKFNFELIYADDGLQGVQTAKIIKPDLIISQIELPVFTGIETGSVLRKEYNYRSAIIFLHDDLNLKIINEAKKLGAKAFLIKPYIDNSLIYAIKRALREENLLVDTNYEPASYEMCRSKIIRSNRLNYA